MTERHEDYAGDGRRMTTGEFRATPDLSASTAQFQAFAEERPDDTRTWDVAAPARSNAKVAMIVGAVVVLAIIVILVVALG
jgi:hypothetical protein